MKNNHLDKFSIKIVPFLFILTYFFFQPVFPHSLLRTHGMSPPFRFIQQNYSLQGSVSDVSGPLAGVNILIKGKSQGTLSDLNGNYKLRVSPTDTLVFSYVGFKTLSIAVHGLKKLDVILQSEATQLQEVEVNAGYYTVKDKERTGSISKINAKEIEQQPIVSPLQALEGRMPGVEVEQGTGITGLAPTIRIRGTNSLRNDGNYPLFIIDGVPVNSTPLKSSGSLTVFAGIDPLSTLNLSNIESMEVLKDADATAIYGSRGANGVVLITTKKGNFSQDKTALDISLYSGISEASNKAELLNTTQYLSIRRKAIANDGLLPTDVYAPDLTLWDQNRYTDWQEVLFGKTAITTDINMAVSGGNSFTFYRIGGSYFTQGSIFPGEFDYRKSTVNMSLGHKSQNSKFELNLSANFGADNNRIFNGSNFMNYALTIPPNAPPIYKEDGSLNWDNWVVDNPLAVLKQPQNIKTDNLVVNMNLSYMLLNGFHIKMNLGYSKMDSEDVIKYYKERYNPNRWNRVNLGANQGTSTRRTWIIEPQMTYSTSLDGINIDALAGTTFQQDENSYYNISSSGYVNKSLIGNLSAADKVRIVSDVNTDYRYAALFGRLGINLHKKYFVNLTGRRDGSSRFGPDRRFSNFWALGGAWMFSEEKFIRKNLSFLSFGKLRASYGTTGNDQIPDYGFLDTYETTDGVGGLYPTQLFNADYSWELNKKLETALQLGFFKDRIDLEVNWYRNRSSNQLVGYPLPAISGFSSVQANLPALVQNTGWEIQMGTTNIIGSNFTWKTALNLTVPDNELVEFNNIDQTPYARQYRVGYPLNISLVYQYNGIDPETGFYQVMDINGDGKYNSDDRTVIENRGRIYYGGISNNLSYKGLTLQFLLEYIKQNNQNFIFGASGPGQYGNGPVDFLDSWERPGDNENIQKLSQSNESITAFNRAASSSLGIVDASFLRLKNISLSYQLPRQVQEHINVKSLNIYLRAQNLFTITPYKGLDPQGGRNVVPPLRTITCGIQLNL